MNWWRRLLTWLSPSKRAGHQLKLRDQYFSVGRHQIHLRVLRDLKFYGGQESDIEEAKNLGISREAFPVFGVIWASGEVMADRVAGLDLSGKRVLEIGCGLALPSHVMNAEGVDVTAMDIHPVVGELLAINSALNGQKAIPFTGASWSDLETQLGTYDLVIGSDILYEPRHVQHLPGFLARHVADGGRAMIASPERGQLAEFIRQMTELGFAHSLENPAFTDHAGIPYGGALVTFERQ